MRLHLDNNAALGGAGQAGGPSGAQPLSSGNSRSEGLGSGVRDSVSLSGPSAALGRLASDRAARVQQLTAAVQSGSYNVSSSAISSAIVGHAAA